MRLRTLAALVCFMGGASAAELPAIREALRLAGEAITAGEANDAAGQLAKMEQAVELRPDVPQLLINLAAAQVAADRGDDAIATLNRLAALGLSSPVERADEFAPLRERKEFGDVVQRFAANSRAKGRGDTAFTLRDVTGLIEGIAWRQKSGEFYFGDVNGRAVWRQLKDGKLQRLTAEGDELLGVFGLAIDETSGTIWAATAAVPQMRGYAPAQEGEAALVEIDLESGEVRRNFPVPRKSGPGELHGLRGVTVTGDGNVYATDGEASAIWRVAAGGSALEGAVESLEFLALRGIAVLPTGPLVVADHQHGLLAVEPASGAVRRLEAPEGVTLAGINGLTVAPNGALFALQDGVRPTRVLRIRVDPAGETITSVEVVESGHLTMAAPSQGCIGKDGDFYFIGNAGWSRFEDGTGEPSSPRPVPVFKVSLGGKSSGR